MWGCGVQGLGNTFWTLLLLTAKEPTFRKGQLQCDVFCLLRGHGISSFANQI